MLGTTICSTMWPSRSGGIPTPISDPSMVTRNRILLLLLPCNPYQVAPPLTMIPDNKSVNTFFGAQQQTLIHRESEKRCSRTFNYPRRLPPSQGEVGL